MLKIGKNLIFPVFLFLGILLNAYADEDFQVELDQNKISLQDSVSLSVSSTSDVNAIDVKAPDFVIGNQYSSMSMQSYYDGAQGQFVSQTQRKLTRVLSPKRAGILKIAVILPASGGKPTQTKEFIVEVKSAESVTSSQDSQNQKSAKSAVFLQAEVKKNAFKGEQLIVGYYLYHAVKIFNIEVEKYPILSGFLRQDLNIPVVGQRLSSQQVTQGGGAYNRTLLAQYAAYPLQNGELSIDSMAIKLNYYGANHRVGLDEEDPFFGFFQQMAPRVAEVKSEVVRVNVLPLPAGAPLHFSGGVGDFNVLAAVNKYEVRANEAFSLTVKIDGQGNSSSIAESQIQWPETLEMYESKGRPGSSRGGANEKILEYLLIPRVPGELILPAIEFSFFDPVKKQYYTKATESFHIKVLDPAPGSALVPVHRAAVPSPIALGEAPVEKVAQDLRYLQPPTSQNDQSFVDYLWRALYLACGVAFSYLWVLIGTDGIRWIRGRRRTIPARSTTLRWNSLSATAENREKLTGHEVIQFHEALSALILEALETAYVIPIRGLSLVELRVQLVDERHFSVERWKDIVKVLERCDQVRFAGASSQSVHAKDPVELRTILALARKIVEHLKSTRPA